MKAGWLVGLAVAASVVSSVLAQTQPKATLSDDLAGPGPVLVDKYIAQRPRLLFTEADREALAKKAKDQPARWNAVLASSRRLGTAPPSGDDIKNGKGYWRIERMQSGALAYFVTGDDKHLAPTVAWMKAVAGQDTWGTQFRPNKDLEASWYLYHLAIAYDILHAKLSDDDRKLIRDSLTAHAKFIADDYEEHIGKDKFRYDQNHTYIPATALATASLALLGEAPEAEGWLKLASAVLNRCRYVLGPDGYYFEGFGYWTYALHWHIRYAELMSRATGQNFFDVPAFKENWRFALHMSLPGTPGAFDVGDIGQWKGDTRTDIKVTNHGMLWAVAGALKSPESRTAADLYDARAAEADYPASAFLWFAADVTPAPLEKITPYQLFNDHDIVTWRSGWDKDATAFYFRSGPPEGHAAAAKLKQLTDWIPNAGHVHPDIGAFYLYAKGGYLATTTGYTVEKWTRDHNTLLIDGKGQAMDGEYHNERGVPYDQLDACKIEASHLTPAYGYARGTFGSAYARQVKGMDVKRSVLITKNWLLIADELSPAEGHSLTWLCHTPGPFAEDGPAFVAKTAGPSLAVIPLTTGAQAKMEPTTVIAGLKPGQGTPTQRGHHLSLTLKDAGRMLNLLVPLAAGEKAPTIADKKLDGDTVSLTIQWPDGRNESVTLNLKWTKDGEPAVIK